MKLQTLNIWAGRVYQELIDHIREQSNSIDVFCFQEVYDSSELTYTRGDVWDGTTSLSQAHRARASIYRELAELLPQFQGIYHAAQDHTDHLGCVTEDLKYGLASFIRNTISVEDIGEVFVHQTKNGIIGTDFSTLPRNIQYIKIPYHQTILTIVNFHGLWNGQGKSDSPARLEQSQKLKRFLQSCPGPVIVCGDFNLLPETESFQIISEGLRDLVKEYDVESTRSSYYQKPIKFADYILVSPEVNVLDFKVLDAEVSDHLPLYLEFN